MKTDIKKILLTTILALILLLSVFRIINYTILFSEQSLQMDFTAYYAAGKSLNNGLSPYINHITTRWDLWDGVASFKHSRFLYPPLVANMFQPIATLPFVKAKYVWNFFNLFCFSVCLFILLKLFGFFKETKDKYFRINKILFTGILGFNFFPFIALLERGQIDCVTLLLILIGLSLLLTNSKKDFLSGLVFGLATVFKLYSVLLIPFFILKKKYTVLYGYATGIVLIIILTFLISGKDLTYKYITEEAPRIAKYGSGGTADMRIPVWILQAYFPMTPTSISIIDGRKYLTESISFNSKASFIRLFEVISDKLKIGISNSVISIIIFLLFFFSFYFIVKKNLENINPEYKFIYWLSALSIILLSSPYTWVMNLIWLIPVSAIIISKFDYLILQKKYSCLLLLIIGFILISFPDNLHFTKNLGVLSEMLKSRFVIGELLILLGLISYLKLYVNGSVLNADKTETL